MNDLRFNEKDLEANRQGRLTDAQRKRLEAEVDQLRQQRRTILVSFVAFATFIVVTGGIWQYNNAGQDLTKFLSGARGIDIVLLAGLLVLVLCAGLLSSWWSTQRLARGTVRTVEGKVRIIKRIKRAGGRKTPEYNVEIQRNAFSKRIFRLQDPASLDHFEAGRRYRVYFLSHTTPQALSVEDVTDEKTKS